MTAQGRQCSSRWLPGQVIARALAMCTPLLPFPYPGTGLSLQRDSPGLSLADNHSLSVDSAPLITWPQHQMNTRRGAAEGEGEHIPTNAQAHLEGAKVLILHSFQCLVNPLDPEPTSYGQNYLRKHTVHSLTLLLQW